MRNPPDITTELDNIQLDDDTLHAARLTVCRHATDTADAAMLLQMLGLTDSESAAPPELACDRCGHPCYGRNWDKARRAGRRMITPSGLCTRCVQHDRDADPAIARRRDSRGR